MMYVCDWMCFKHMYMYALYQCIYNKYIYKENQLNEERMEVHALRDELAEEKVRLKDATSVGDNKTVS
jgi:hypothetical protein